MKFASAAFQTLAKNEIGYTPASPRCEDCHHHLQIRDEAEEKWACVCGILGPVGWINVDLNGNCKLFEVERAKCVPKGAAE